MAWIGATNSAASTFTCSSCCCGFCRSSAAAAEFYTDLGSCRSYLRQVFRVKGELQLSRSRGGFIFERRFVCEPVTEERGAFFDRRRTTEL